MPVRRSARQGFVVQKVSLFPKERAAEPRVIGWEKLVFVLEVEAKTLAGALPPWVRVVQVLCELAIRGPFFRASEASTLLSLCRSCFSSSIGGHRSGLLPHTKNTELLKISLPMGAASVPRTLLVGSLDRVNAIFSPRGVRPLALLLLLLLSKALPNDCLSWSHMLTTQNEPSCCIAIRTWPLGLALTTRTKTVNITYLNKGGGCGGLVRCQR